MLDNVWVEYKDIQNQIKISLSDLNKSLSKRAVLEFFKEQLENEIKDFSMSLKSLIDKVNQRDFLSSYYNIRNGVDQLYDFITILNKFDLKNNFEISFNKENTNDAKYDYFKNTYFEHIRNIDMLIIALLDIKSDLTKFREHFFTYDFNKIINYEFQKSKYDL